MGNLSCNSLTVNILYDFPTRRLIKSDLNIMIFIADKVMTTYFQHIWNDLPNMVPKPTWISQDCLLILTITATLDVTSPVWRFKIRGSNDQDQLTLINSMLLAKLADTTTDDDDYYVDDAMIWVLKIKFYCDFEEIWIIIYAMVWYSYETSS